MELVIATQLSECQRDSYGIAIQLSDDNFDLYHQAAVICKDKCEAQLKGLLYSLEFMAHRDLFKKDLVLYLENKCLLDNKSPYSEKAKYMLNKITRTYVVNNVCSLNDNRYINALKTANHYASNLEVQKFYAGNSRL